MLKIFRPLSWKNTVAEVEVEGAYKFYFFWNQHIKLQPTMTEATQYLVTTQILSTLLSCVATTVQSEESVNQEYFSGKWPHECRENALLVKLSGKCHLVIFGQVTSLAKLFVFGRSGVIFSATIGPVPTRAAAAAEPCTGTRSSARTGNAALWTRRPADEEKKSIAGRQTCWTE